MMTLLAKGLMALLGAPKLLSTGLLLGALMLGHQWRLERDARLHMAGVQQCEDKHQLVAMKAERDQARRAVAAAVEAIEVEKKLTEDMRHERQTITAEFEAYKDAASSDPRCLSDGVLDLLRGKRP
jgi:hypothetical protein